MKDGRLQAHREHYPSGMLKTEWTEKDGKLEGMRRFWFENGQLFAEAEYRDGLTNGVIREWTEDGQLTLLATCKDGKLDGHYQSWWDDGVPKEDGFYLQGRSQKGYRWFRPNGELWRESVAEGSDWSNKANDA